MTVRQRLRVPVGTIGCVRAYALVWVLRKKRGVLAGHLRGELYKAGCMTPAVCPGPSPKGPVAIPITTGEGGQHARVHTDARARMPGTVPRTALRHATTCLPESPKIPLEMSVPVVTRMQCKGMLWAEKGGAIPASPRQ